MMFAQLIHLMINISIFLIVFALGLKTQKGDAAYLQEHPSLLARSVLSMNVVMVVVAASIAALFELPLPVQVALIALAVSPVPPILPSKQQKAGGSPSYSISLLVVASLASIVLAPLAVSLVGGFFGRQTAISPGRIVMVVLASVIMPLGLGIAVRVYLPRLASHFARPISIAGSVLLGVAVLPVLVTSTPVIWHLLGNGVALALVAFALIGLAVGHLLGWPQPENRTVLALATSTRHPGVAMAVASLNFPHEKATLAVVFFHLLIGAIVAFPYVRWRRGGNADHAEEPR